VVLLVVSVVHLTWGWCSHLFFLGWWLWILLVKQICVSMVIWVFTLGFLDLLVPGFNELPQWLQLGQTGIPLWLFPIEKANNWLGCWSQFEILLAFMVQNEAMWGEHWLLLLVLNFNGFLDGDHGWNSCIGWQELGTPIGLNNLAVSKQWKKAMHGMGSQWAFDLYAMVLPLCISVLFEGKRTRKKNILLKSKLAAKHKEPFHINQLYHGFSHLFFILLESLLQSRSKVYFIQTVFLI
jgi:hypothetical protein